MIAQVAIGAATTQDLLVGLTTILAAVFGLAFMLVRWPTERRKNQNDEDTVIITRAQGAGEFLNDVVQTLGGEIERKDRYIERLEASIETLRTENDNLRTKLRDCGEE